MKCDGALAVVTGAGSGIGRATALAFAERGARVIAADIDAIAAEKTAVMCNELGGAPARFLALDVTDRQAFLTAAQGIEDEDGPVDVAVNNAGVGMSGRFADMTLDDWDWIKGVNLDGVVNGCAAFGPRMVARGRGHVVNVSSGLAYTPTATEPAYVTTKAAVLALSQCLRADWAGAGVGVSAICPGVINTPIVDRTRFLGDQDDPERKERTTRIFRRGHRPEKVGAAIVAAVERNRAIVPVGFEAWAGWILHRAGPIRLQQVIAKGLR